MRVSLLIELKGFGLWGAGKEGFEADILSLKLKAEDVEIPIIPAPYVKGLLRGWAYRVSPLLKSKGLVDGEVNKGCNPKRTCGECVVCRIFGSSGFASSPIRVTNFYPIEEVINAKELDPEEVLEKKLYRKIPTLVLPHVRIDDLGGKAYEGALFFTEVVPMGALFYGKVFLLDNLLKLIGVSPIEAARIVLSSISQLNYGYSGRRSRVRVKVLEADLGIAREDTFCSEVLEGLR